MNSQAIYNKLPVALQNLAVSFEGWRLNRKRYDAAFDRLLLDYESRASWDEQAIARFRDQRIAQFVARAAKHVPYYRQLFESLKIDPAEIRGLDDLQHLPILPKQQVRDDPSAFISDDLDSHRVMWHRTSGTTGAGLSFPSTWEASREQWALWWRYRRWHGIQRDHWCCYFGNWRPFVPHEEKKPPYWRINRPARQILFSLYHLGPHTADVYIEALQRFQSPWIHGYPSMLSLIAGYAVDRGMQIPARWVSIGSETLLPHQESLIEQAFCVKPIQNYGMAEATANASECPAGKLHADEDFAATEFVPADDGDGYRVVGTNFTNPVFPLIRYEIGDVATIDPDDRCTCGRPGRIVSRIDGRQDDYVVTKSGARLGRLGVMFKNMSRIRETQIHQARPGFITVRVVKGDGYGDDDHRALLAALDERIGHDVDYEIEYVSELVRSKRGKLRLVVSELDP